MLILLVIVRVLFILLALYLFLLVASLAQYKEDIVDRALVVTAALFASWGVISGSIVIGCW